MVPTIQIDYMYPFGQQGMKALSIVDTSTGYGATTAVRSEGATDKFAIDFCVRVLDEMGYHDVVFRPMEKFLWSTSRSR